MSVLLAEKMLYDRFLIGSIHDSYIFIKIKPFSVFHHFHLILPMIETCHVILNYSMFTFPYFGTKTMVILTIFMLLVSTHYCRYVLIPHLSTS